jgi:dTMP kinase
VIAALERVVVGATRPDLTLILDVPAELGLARAADRRGGPGERADRFEAEDIAFHQRLRRAFLDIAEGEPDRCAVVDASCDAAGVENRIWQAVAGRFLDEDDAEIDAARALANG